MHSLAKDDSSSESAVARCVLLARPARRDTRTAKLVYRALILRKALGASAAAAFVAANRIPVSLWERVLRRDAECLRR